MVTNASKKPDAAAKTKSTRSRKTKGKTTPAEKSSPAGKS